MRMLMRKATFLGLGAALAMAVAAGAALAEGDAAKGEKLFKTRCFTCHNADKSGKHKVGPNLFGVVGNRPGQAAGYKYSKSYTQAADKGLTWGEKEIFDYLTDPHDYVRKAAGDPRGVTKMTFKLTKEDERNDVIAYLKTLK